MDSRIEQDLMDMAGLMDSDLVANGGDFELVEIPVAQLVGYGTACGEVPNKPFDAKAIGILEKAGVEIFYAAVQDAVDYDNTKGAWVDLGYRSISSGVVKLNQRAGEQFSNRVGRNGGSLRNDNSGMGRGWTSFESE
jgi:hypothetical protein